MPKLIVRNRSKDDIIKKFNTVDYEHNDEAGFIESNKIFPEPELEDTVKRVTAVNEYLYKKYENP